MTARYRAAEEGVTRLPLATLYLTERCNSRCATCDYWQHGHATMTLAEVQRLLPSLQRLQTEVVLLSGGEPLLNPQWPQIVTALRDAGIHPWLLTSGLSLAKHAAVASQRFAAITVSLDGADAQTYRQIRGLDAFDQVRDGIRAAVERGGIVTLRTTVQRANFGQLRRLVGFALELGVRQISFLAVDVASRQAFGRSGEVGNSAALAEDDLALFELELAHLQREYAAQFRSRFIAESPAKLARLLQYFAALRGRGAFPAVRCNAPEFSAVITAGGCVQPCYFIGGPADAMLRTAADPLAEVLDSSSMQTLRAAIRAGARAECKTCVCSLWRDPATLPGSLRLSA